MTETKADKKWLEDLTLELRLQNVSGQDVGDALAHVESYCADSGQSPTEAFGDPAAYAAALPLPRRGRWTLRWKLMALFPVSVQVLGLLMLMPALFALEDGTAVSLSMYFLLLGITTVGCLIFAGVTLDGLARRPLLAVVVLLLFNAAVLAITLLEKSTDVPSVTLPAVPTLLIGFSVVIAGSILGQLRGNDQDPVLKPVGSNHVAIRQGQMVTLVINWGLFAGSLLVSAGWLLFG